MRQPRWPSIGLNSCSASLRARTSFSGSAWPTLLARVQVLHEALELLVVVRQELVQGRVEEPDDDRVALHDLEELVEVRLLHGQELVRGPSCALPPSPRGPSRGTR